MKRKAITIFNMTDREKILWEAHLGLRDSDQEIAITMCRRINEALKILQDLGIKTPINEVCYHHYTNSVDERR